MLPPHWDPQTIFKVQNATTTPPPRFDSPQPQLHFKRWSAPGLWKLLRVPWWKKLFSEHLFEKQKQVCDSHLLGTGTSLFYADNEANSPHESTQGSFKTFLSFIKQMAKLSMLCHFRVALSLCFKARLWKRLFILVQIKLIFTWKIFHLASFWKR